ncbi:MAG: TolC family protein [Opitutales bacterium]|nr:TolC family protein [Opitutales bacterium]
MKPLSIFKLIAATSLVGLVGCTTTQTTQEVNQSARNATVAGMPETNDYWKTVVENTAVEVNWIQAFEDPVLIELIDEALQNNNDLALAASNVEQSRLLAEQAGVALKPYVGLAAGGSGSGSIENASTSSSRLDAAVQSNWEVDVWGRIRSGQQSAVASLEAAQADYLFTQYSIAAATAKSYFIVIEAKLQKAIIDKSMESLEETLRIVTVQHENGLASTQDLALTKSDLAVAKESSIALEGSLRDASRSLELLLGRYPSAELEVAGKLPTVPPMPPVGLPSELLERRPDIVAAERRIAASINQLEQTKVANLPTLSLTSTVGGSSDSLGEVLNPQNIVWSAAGNLLAPIFDGGNNEIQVEIATEQQKQAITSYVKAALQAFGEVETYLDQGQTLQLRKVQLESAVEEANKAYRIAQVRHREGEIALIDVLSIQQRVLGAESNLASLNRAILDQRVDLNLAVGGSWN